MADGPSKTVSQRYEEFLERKKQDKRATGDLEIEDMIRKRVRKLNDKENQKANTLALNSDIAEERAVKKQPTVLKAFNLKTQRTSRQKKPSLDEKKVSAKVSGKVLGVRRALTIKPTVPEPFELSKSYTLDKSKEDDQRMGMSFSPSPAKIA